MAEFLKKTVSWLIYQVILAAICWATYILTLESLTEFKIGFLNWVGIIIIVSCITPTKKTNNNSAKNTEEKSKFEMIKDIVSNGR
jgi:hypothetical protein